MVLPVQTPNVEYTADNVQKVFTYTFTVDLGSTIVVNVDGHPQTEYSEYTVENITEFGGEIHFIVAPLYPAIIHIYRHTPLEQQVDFEPFEAFPADTLEWSLDRIIRIIQEMQGKLTGGGVPGGNLIQSVFGRVGHIIAVAGDYKASFISYVNGISGMTATNVQDAIDELHASSGGVSDHGALTGLVDDDHKQYHTDTRGDARYPRMFTQAGQPTGVKGDFWTND